MGETTVEPGQKPALVLSREFVLPLSRRLVRRSSKSEVGSLARRRKIRSQSPDELSLVPACEFVFPNTNDLPAACAEGAVDAAIASLIRGDLLPPEGGVVFRLGRVFRTPVPEAAVDVDCEFKSGKNEIRFARELRAAPPAGDAVRAHKRNEPKFGVLVSAPTNARHDLGTFGFGEDVGHGSNLHSLDCFVERVDVL